MCLDINFDINIDICICMYILLDIHTYMLLDKGIILKCIACVLDFTQSVGKS